MFFSIPLLVSSFFFAETPTQVSKASSFNSARSSSTPTPNAPRLSSRSLVSQTDPFNARILFLLVFSPPQASRRSSGSSEYLVDDARNLSVALVAIPGTAFASIP
ncbi:hypothetical protein R3P38DRAFT_2818669, partial [Favolaschia claudopus]